MIKKFIFVLFSFSLVACSSQDNLHKKEASVEVKAKPYTRKITEEEQKYIQLVLNKDFDTILEQTKNLTNEVQQDYNNIAFILNKFEEAKKLEEENDPYNAVEIEVKYYSIPRLLEDVKYIPDKIKNQIDEVKKTSNEKVKYYSKIVHEQTEQRQKEYEKESLIKQANQRTEDPQPVTIGMTTEEVLTEGWGRPSDINRNTTKSGVSEQWVYPGYKYLYFEDGVLVTIQD